MVTKPTVGGSLDTWGQENNDALDDLQGQITNLGGAALLDVGTTAGTVAAGDDTRFSGGGGGSATFAVLTADVTGGVNAAPGFATADADGNDIYVPPGTYRFTANATLTGRYWLARGAVLKPDAGITVVFTGSIVDAGSARLFDVTAAGARVQLDGYAPTGRPEWWGAKGDWQRVTDAAITTGTAVLSSANGLFTAADVGKSIGVAGAAGTNVTLTTTILSYQSATQVTLAANATTTVTAAKAQWWTDDRQAIQACFDAVARSKNPTVQFSGRTYIASRSASNAWSLDMMRTGAADGTTTSGGSNISSATMRFTPADEGAYIFGTGIPPLTTILSVTSATTAVLSVAATASAATVTFTIPISNITLRGVRGATWVKHPTGMPNAAVAILRLFENTNVTFHDMGFDGNWGNAVGLVTNQAGINHTTQVDPHNYGVQVRGTNNVTFDHCKFRQTYGDFIWVGAGNVGTFAQNTRILNCDGDMCARDGIAAAQPADGIEVGGCSFTNVFTQAFDTEPGGGGYVKNVHLHDSHFGHWWNTASADIYAVTISGGTIGDPLETNYASRYRVENCTIDGNLLIQSARDIVVDGCRIICDYRTQRTAAVLIEAFVDNIWITNNYIYNNIDDFVAIAGVVDIIDYQTGTGHHGAGNVTVSGNQIFARAGRKGITVQNTGQSPPWSSASTYALGTRIRYNNITYRALGASLNSAPDTNPADWQVWNEANADGSGGIVTLADNTIDCADDGSGIGAEGIYLKSGTTGMRVAILRNKIRNASVHAIYCASPFDAAYPFLHLEIVGNKAWDDQATPTCLSTVHLVEPRRTTQLIMNGNTAGDGVATAVTGPTAGFWQTSGDMAPNFVGFGTPEAVVTAPIGSRYQRLNGAADATTYRKESGTGNTGWVADTALPANAVQHARAIKAADQSVTSSVGLVDCTDLGFAVGANEEWTYRFVLFYDAATTGDLRTAITGPTAPSPTLHTYGAIGLADSAASATGTHQTTSTATGANILNAGLGAGGTRPMLIIEGVIVNSTAAGTVQLRFAQETSDAAATRVFAGSFLTAHRVVPA